MGEDYGDMMRRERERREHEALLRQWGREGDPEGYAVELAEGREAKNSLFHLRRALSVLREASRG